MAVPKGKVSRQRRDKRRSSHWKLTAPAIVKCPNCGEEIRQIAKRKKKRFCCDKCRNEWWNSHLELIKRKAYYEHTCQGCGKTFTSYGDRNRKYCCHECYVKDRFGSEQVE